MSTNKRLKIDSNEFYTGIGKLEYKGDNVAFDDTLCYRFYNANERFNGRTMADWIKPAISFTALKLTNFHMNGKLSYETLNTKENYKRFINSAFELCAKLGVRYWTAYDSDLIPDFENFDEYSSYMDDISDYIQDYQQRLNIKPLWISPDFNRNTKYKFRSETCHDAHMLMFACHQTRKCLDFSLKLNAEGFLMNTNGQGCVNILNTDILKEMKHFGQLLKMTADYKERIGFRGQLLLYSKNVRNKSFNHDCDQMIKPYMYDTLSGYCFLKHHNLDRIYKQITDPGFQFHLGVMYSTIGSVELSNHSILIKDATLLMKTIIEQGGLNPGGFNICIPWVKQYTDGKDLIIYYLRHIDNLAKGFKIGCKMISDQIFSKNIQQRYISYYSGVGSRFGNGEASFEEAEEQIRKHHNHVENTIANRSEHWELMYQNYMNLCKFN